MSFLLADGFTAAPNAGWSGPDTGLVYLRARVYDPATGQFLTVDPDVGATRAPYNSAEDNPLNEVDPFGRSVLGEIGNFLEPLNPVKYYEEEIESYENGCGYFASVAHGLEGAVIGVLDVSGEGEAELGAEDADVGEYLAGKAPQQVTPGTASLTGQYVNDLGRVEPWTAHYDEYGRLIGRTDYNAGNASQGIPDVHYHTYEYGPGYESGFESGAHIPGEYQP